MLVLPDVPIPATHSPIRADFEALEPNQVAIYPGGSKQVVAALINYRKKHPHKKFVQRTIKSALPNMPENLTYPVIGVWRTE